jgi:hypothetical protein
VFILTAVSAVKRSTCRRPSSALPAYFYLTRGIALHKFACSLAFFGLHFFFLFPQHLRFLTGNPFLGRRRRAGAKKREIKKASAAFRKAAEVQPVLAEYNRLTNTAVNINELLADDQ